MIKWIDKVIFFVIFIFLTNGCGVKKSLSDRPDISQFNATIPKVEKINDSLFVSNKNYLIKNKYNQWELYVSGDPLEIGLTQGALMDSILQKQEKALFGKVEEFIPSKRKQKQVLGFLRFYNRNIYKFVPNEYKAEIYGISQFVDSTFNFVAPPYIRSLYLHAAHDIGHALLDMSIINECTSAALWGGFTENGELLLGRNLDLYIDDNFAEEQLIQFVKPNKGIPFVSISWPGMIGVVSGMNNKGLTITMNSGKSKIPWSAKEPISLVARKILQYASNLEEAVQIAKKCKVFVSESLMIGSAEDNDALLIEMSPKRIGIYRVTENSNKLVCSNHFQSEAYRKDRRNKDRIKNSHSMYRFLRMTELIDSTQHITPTNLASILRNKEGIHGEKLGYGNELAINQLLSHHGVIFKPKDRKIWISSHPYNLGEFTCYDLNEIFSSNNINFTPRFIDSLTIEKDSFLSTQAYENYEKYRKKDREIDKLLAEKKPVFKASDIELFISYNPDLWEVYYKAGILYYNSKDYFKAKEMFEIALTKKITTLPDRKKVEEKLQKTKRKVRFRNKSTGE